MSVTYRPFRNPDPPGLVRVWNESLAGRGAAFLQGTTPLEHYVLAKPYFDRQGLIVAEEDNQIVGYVHSGFGPDASGQHLDTSAGVICVLMVVPPYRGRGIGSELLRQGTDYLRGKGAQSIYFGAMRPMDPFYLGLYGGSELPGVLNSDTLAAPFLQKRGFQVLDRVVVLNRSLDSVPGTGDPRFGALRRKVELRILPRPVAARWFDECIISPLEILEFQLQETSSGQPVARARVWDMDLFGWRWHQPTAGIFELEVRPDRRRQGMGKFLVVQILRYLQDQFYTLNEVQVPEGNQPATSLFRALGYRQIDEGRQFRLENHG